MFKTIEKLLRWFKSDRQMSEPTVPPARIPQPPAPSQAPSSHTRTQPPVAAVLPPRPGLAAAPPGETPKVAPVSAPAMTVPPVAPPPVAAASVPMARPAVPALPKPLPSRPAPDGKYAVSFVDETLQGEILTVRLEVLSGPRVGTKIPMVFEGPVIKRAFKELNRFGYEDLCEFGSAKASLLRDAVHNSGQFLVTVKDGTVRSILDPDKHFEEVEKLVNQQTYRPEGDLHQPRFAELIDLAIQHKIPLDFEIGGGSTMKEGLVPIEWKDAALILKRFPEDWDHEGEVPLKGKSSKIRAGAISDISLADEDFPDSIEAFVAALAKSGNAANRELAAQNLQYVYGESREPAAAEILQGLAHDESRRVRAVLAQGLGPLCPSDGRKVGKQGHHWTVTDPVILSLSTELAADPDRDVRKQACYPLGYCTWSSARAVLEGLKANDPAEDIRYTAGLALERLDRNEQAMAECEAAEAELLKNPPPQAKRRRPRASTEG